MAIELPGLSLSLLRQDTQTQAGKPVLISGRFTAFGLGVPGLVRVYLEGPSYNPEKRTFDAFAQPFSGDWSVQVVTEKDGQYDLYAQAFLVPALPSGPAFPENLLLLPPVAESTKPPLVVGSPVEGGVNALTPSGTEFLQTPTQTPIELFTTVGAPAVSISIPGLGQVSIPSFPTPTIPQAITIEAPTPGYAPTPPAAEIPPVTYIPSPGELPAPTEVTGLPTDLTGLPKITELKIPTFPTYPTVAMIGTPYANLPSQLDIGDTFSGNVQIPTSIPSFGSGFQQLLPGAPELPSYQFNARVSLEDENGVRYNAASGSTSVQLGQPFYMPVNFPTTNLKEGRYNVYLTITDAANRILFDNIIGRLYLVALPAPTGLPGVTVPTTLSSAWFGTPTLSGSSTVDLGQTWVGAVNFPTRFPVGVTALPSLPTHPIILSAQLEAPNGQRFSAGRVTPEFKPGENLRLPLSVDTNKLPGVGSYNIFLSLTDIAGKSLLPSGIPAETIGFLKVLKAPTLPELPTPPTVPEVPEIPGVPKFNIGQITASPKLLTGDQQVTVTAPVTNQSAAAVAVTVYFNFREGSRLPGGGTLLATSSGITRTMQPGETYNFQASRVETSTKDRFDVGCEVRVAGVKVASREDDDVYNKKVPAAPTSYIPRVDVVLPATTVGIGGSLRIPFAYQHSGPTEAVTIYAAIGNSGAFGFDEVLHTSQSLVIPDDAQLASHPTSITIPITSTIAAGKTYSVFVKLQRTSTGLGEVVSPVVKNVVTVKGVAKLTCTSSLKTGDKLTYNFSGFQPNASVNVFVEGGGGLSKTADSSGAGSGSFTIGESGGNYTLVAQDNYGNRATAPFTVQAAPTPAVSVTTPTVKPGDTLRYSYSGFQPNSTIYSAIRNIGNVNGRSNSQGAGSLSATVPSSMSAGTYVIAVTDSAGHSATASFTVQAAAAPAAPPSLSCTRSLKTGDTLYLSFSGFQPNAPVRVYVQGGGGITPTASSTGSGSYNFRIGESPGNYTLVAEDSYGHRATSPFTVTAAAAPAPATLRVTNSPTTGGPLNFSWSGFQPNATVYIYVQGGGGANFTSNSSGGGNGAFSSISEKAGNYTLTARDSYGHSASAGFTVR